MRDILAKIEEQVAAGLYLGASLAVFDGGSWQDYYLGKQDDCQPTVAGLVYDLASVSKVVGVATVLLQLLDEGLVELDIPLKTYYPAVMDDQVTIRQLVTHTSGIDPFIPNRNDLSKQELIAAINAITVGDDKSFFYTDINFLLLGFLLEQLLEAPLDKIFQDRIFSPLQMTSTSFGPCLGAVPTQRGVVDGQVHDPKARLLGTQAGSAGLFSTLADLKRFCDYYLTKPFDTPLLVNHGKADKTRSIGWDLEGNWLLHTGYTGPFLMLNPVSQQALIFLTNRTYAYDDRPLWIEKRRELTDLIQAKLNDF